MARGACFTVAGAVGRLVRMRFRAVGTGLRLVAIAAARTAICACGLSRTLTTGLVSPPARLARRIGITRRTGALWLIPKGRLRAIRLAVAILPARTVAIGRFVAKGGLRTIGLTVAVIPARTVAVSRFVAKGRLRSIGLAITVIPARTVAVSRFVAKGRLRSIGLAITVIPARAVAVSRFVTMGFRPERARLVTIATAITTVRIPLHPVAKGTAHGNPLFR